MLICANSCYGKLTGSGVELCQELIEGLRMLRLRTFTEIEVGKDAEMVEACFAEGEMLHCLVYLKVARLAQGSQLRTCSKFE